MRLVLMLVSVLVISILVFKGYSGSFSHQDGNQVDTTRIDPRDKARDVNQVILDSANTQKREIEKQLQ